MMEKRMTAEYRVVVEKEYLKFSAAHFIAYKGFREALHGHNYRISVEVEGQLGNDGYVVDFGVVKKLAREICGHLDEKVLVPTASDVLSIREEDGQVAMVSETGRFSFPRTDCVMLPIVHSSAEELARYLAGELRQRLRERGVAAVDAIQVGVEETTGQAAFYRHVG
jgi:6-pyruvoyltetrahydropterin/6-carboxytetrahydropterin synthase